MAVLMKVKELPFCGTLAPINEDEITHAVVDLFPEIERVHHVHKMEDT